MFLDQNNCIRCLTVTVRFQPPNLLDKLLSMLGKRRAVRIPDMTEPYGYYIARRESFLRALLRPVGNPPPDGWVYWDDDVNDGSGGPR